MVEASLGASTDDDFFDELFFLLLLLSSSSLSLIVIVAWRSFEVKAFFPEDIYCVCSYVFLMRFLKRLKFLKIQRELSDDSNVTPFTNFNVKSDLLLTRRVSRTKVFFCCLSESCSKIASSLLRVYNPREKSQKILREKVTKNEGKTNRQ